MKQQVETREFVCRTPLWIRKIIKKERKKTNHTLVTKEQEEVTIKEAEEEERTRNVVVALTQLITKGTTKELLMTRKGNLASSL